MDASEESRLDPHLHDFIADQLTLCLGVSQQWDDLHRFLLQEEKRKRVTIPLLSITAKQVENIVEYYETSDIAVMNLSEWETLHKETIGFSNDFSYHRTISLAENTLSHLCIQPSNQQFNTELERQCASVIQSCLQESLRTRSHEHLNQITILNHICHVISERKNTKNRVNTQNFGVDKRYGSATLLRLLCWTDFFDNDMDGGGQINLSLRMDVCATNRKEGNLTHCRKQLQMLIKKLKVCDQIGVLGGDEQQCFDAFCDRLTVETDVNIWNRNTIRAVCEVAKWMNCYPEQKDRAIQFNAANIISISRKIDEGKVANDDVPIARERIARSLLNLSEWIQTENECLEISSPGKPIGRLIELLGDPKRRHVDETDIWAVEGVMSPVDAAMGKIISHSINQCPSLAKTWSAYGNWCYRWGRKVVEQRWEKSSGIDNEAITGLIPSASQKDIQQIVDVLNQSKATADDDEVIISNDPDESFSLEAIESQLRSVEALNGEPAEVLHRIIEIWRQSNRSTYCFYESAADAYFKYLQLATSTNDASGSSGEDSSANCSIVTATLRILRLIVKHALELQQVLEKGLETTPTTPWKAIIPQLFSRLNHHEPYVRKRVSELLCRVASDSPHLIIFPAVVGAAKEHQTDFHGMSMTAPTANSALTVCFNSLLDTLSQQASEPVKQVQVLVQELKRVSLLWEELWLSSLTQTYSENVKRITAFELDVKRAATERDTEAMNALNEKYHQLIRPVLTAVERLIESTSCTPETAHEKAFQERYDSFIREMLESLQRGPTVDSASLDGWLKLKQLHSILQQRAQKRSSCTLKMSEISPILSRMSDTVISMPGVERQHDARGQGTSIYIRSVDDIVHILPTKTKPKKLGFHGSDGHRYTYLFKSLEDLHLDERIMQFLSIANSMMAKTRTVNGQAAKYRAKYYSVIPLGHRSGLISWVEGMTPIFVLYKKWQQRQASTPKKEKAAATTSAASSAAAAAPSPPVILRPSEMFYKKLTPLLAKHNLKTTDNRKDWPAAVLKEVLAELTGETPRDLLAKELWCYSTNAAEWRQVIRNYSKSIAVMSVIGYVIGLGDRHLDNILVDLSTGEILHIDYNVCFEKGKTLRVPEKVPFRMTPNLEEALGVTGIEVSKHIHFTFLPRTDAPWADNARRHGAIETSNGLSSSLLSILLRITIN